MHGTSGCERQGIKVCGNCKLVVVSISRSAVRITIPDTGISIVVSIVKRRIGQSTRRLVDLPWPRQTGALHGIVKAGYHTGRAAKHLRTGIICLEATNTSGEILRR